MKSGNLNFLEFSGPLQACNGTALPLPFISYNLTRLLNAKRRKIIRTEIICTRIFIPTCRLHYINTLGAAELAYVMRTYRESRWGSKLTWRVTSCVINPLNAELNPICNLLALLEAHHIFHVSRLRVKDSAVIWLHRWNLPPSDYDTYSAIRKKILALTYSKMVSSLEQLWHKGW